MRINVADISHEVRNLWNTRKLMVPTHSCGVTDLSSTVGSLLVYIVVAENLVDLTIAVSRDDGAADLVLTLP